MCVSNNFIEKQVFEYSEQIRKNSVYKFVGKEFEGNNISGTLGLDDQTVMIKRVILEDNDGTYYYVSPNQNGLRFAKKEITYKEYKKLQQKETRDAYLMFSVILVFFGTGMVTLMKFLT